MRKLGPRKQLGLHVHCQSFTVGDVKAISPGTAFAVQQRMEHYVGRAGLRSLKPERDEVGKFLTLWICGFQCQTACGQTICLACSDAAEIARALKHGVFLKDAGLFKLCPQAQAGISKGVVDFDVGKFVRRVEDPKVELQGLSLAIFNDVDLDSLRKIETRRKDVDTLWHV